MKQLLLKPVLLIRSQLNKSLVLGSLHIIQCGPSFHLCFLALLSASERLLSALGSHLLYLEKAVFSQSMNFIFSSSSP